MQNETNQRSRKAKFFVYSICRLSYTSCQTTQTTFFACDCVTQTAVLLNIVILHNSGVLACFQQGGPQASWKFGVPFSSLWFHYFVNGLALWGNALRQILKSINPEKAFHFHDMFSLFISISCEIVNVYTR